MGVISLLPIEPVRMFGICVGIPLFLAGMTMGGMGGGDIKISAASGMVLGFEKGMTGVCLGLFLLLVFHAGRGIANKIRRKECK